MSGMARAQLGRPGLSPCDLSSSYRLAWASTHGDRKVPSSKSIIWMNKHLSNFYLCHIINWPKQVMWLCRDSRDRQIDTISQWDKCHMLWTIFSFYHMTLKGQSEPFSGNKTNSERMISLSAWVAKLRRCELRPPGAISPLHTEYLPGGWNQAGKTEAEMLGSSGGLKTEYQSEISVPEALPSLWDLTSYLIWHILFC